MYIKNIIVVANAIHLLAIYIYLYIFIYIYAVGRSCDENNLVIFYTRRKICLNVTMLQTVMMCTMNISLNINGI